MTFRVPRARTTHGISDGGGEAVTETVDLEAFVPEGPLTVRTKMMAGMTVYILDSRSRCVPFSSP